MICPNCNTESGPSLFCYVCDAYLPSISGGVKASLPSRFGAFLLDVFVFLTLLLVIGLIAIRAGFSVSGSYPHYGYGSYQDYGLETLSIIFVGSIIYLLFFFRLLARGQTPGKWLIDIRAVDKRNGSEPGLGRMLFRETLGKWVSGCFLGLGWFWAIWDRDAQAWHDKIARTVVLYQRTQSRKLFAFGLLFGALLLSVGLIWASLVSQVRPQGPGQEATTVRVPFVGCNSGGQSWSPARKGADKVVQMDADVARRLAYYDAYDAADGVLAPRGWYCLGESTSGSSDLFVAPQPISFDDLNATNGKFAGPAIQVSVISGDTSGRFEAAQIMARIFPAQGQFVQKVIEEGIEPASDFPFGPYPEDNLTFENDWVVEYQTPPHSEGLGTIGLGPSFQANDYPISGVLILQGQAPDVLILRVRLQPDMNDLASLIVQQTERDNTTSLAEVNASENRQPLVPSTGSGQISVLGFRFGESARDVGEDADKMGFRLVGCHQSGTDAPESVDCGFARDNGDSLTVTFLQGSLQRLDLNFRIANYDQVLKAIERDHGNPRIWEDGPLRGTAEWGSEAEGFSISLGKTYDTKEWKAEGSPGQDPGKQQGWLQATEMRN